MARCAENDDGATAAIAIWCRPWPNALEDGAAIAIWVGKGPDRAENIYI
jgi:hypothetical protein